MSGIEVVRERTDFGGRARPAALTAVVMLEIVASPARSGTSPCLPLNGSGPKVCAH